MLDNSINLNPIEFQLRPPPASVILSSASLVITSETSYLEIVGDFIRKTAIAAGFDERTARNIELAIDEIASNSIVHGYDNKPFGILKIASNRIDNGIIIILEEKGKLFNPTETTDPDLNVPLAERNIGGLGLYIVRKIADELYFQELPDMTKRFTFVKRIKNSARI